jgi:hypothetical protein
MNKQKILGDRGTSPSAVSDRPTALDNTDSWKTETNYFAWVAKLDQNKILDYGQED